MLKWPQIAMAAWFLAAFALGAWDASKRPQWIVIPSAHRRKLGLGLMLAVAAEVVTLFLGGFWS